MKSYKQWRNRKQYFEFVGPAGQVDPQGITPTPAQPMSYGQTGHDQHLVALMNSLSTKTVNQIVGVQQQFNQMVQQLLKGKAAQSPTLVNPPLGQPGSSIQAQI